MTSDAASATPAAPTPDYPVRLQIDYPEEPRRRLTALVRPLLVIPILIVLALMTGGGSTRWNEPGPPRPPAQVGEHRPMFPFGGFGGFFGMREPRGGYGEMMPGGVPNPAMMPGGVPNPAMMPGGAPPAGMPGYGAMQRGPGDDWDGPRGGGWVRTGTLGAGGVLFLPVLLLLLFRRKYPRWWFDWNRELSRFGARVGAYLLLLRDEYPSTDEEQAVHLEIDYPDALQLNRWLPLVKWFLAIPHYIVLLFLGLGVLLAWIASWVMILVTGRQPRGLHEYMVGVLRWCSRVSGYAFMLVTDRYPPFSLR